MKIITLSNKTVPRVLQILILAGIITIFLFTPNLTRYKTSTKLGSSVNQPIEIFNNANLLQNDTNILEYLRKHHLQFPRNKVRPINIPEFNRSVHARKLKEIFGNKRNGVFIEAGANDGEFYSNTLPFERDFGWTGLLVEPNKIIFPELQNGFRKSWIANVCLAIKPYPHKVNMLHRAGDNKGLGIMEPNSEIPFPPLKFKRNEFFSAGMTECFPLFSLLSAINMTKIDLLSLDVQGVELKILKTLPFECVDIKVIVVEYIGATEGKEAYRDFMIPYGYVEYFENSDDFIFIQKRYLNPNTKQLSQELQWG